LMNRAGLEDLTIDDEDIEEIEEIETSELQ
jgi:hypothetical protein